MALSSSETMQGEFQLLAKSGDVHCSLVKLTDTALKALGSFKETDSSSNRSRPRIQFDASKSSGAIKIPTGNGDYHTFKFAFASMQQDPKSSFECVYFDRENICAKTVGILSHKISVCASDESFKQTKEKVREMRQDDKDKSTKHLESFGKTGKANVKRRSAPKPVRTGTPTPTFPSQKGNLQAIRKHIVHLLAVRPWKRQDLISRIRKDGLVSKSEEIGGLVDRLLREVGRLNPSTGSYTLAEACQVEVSTDWHLLTASDKQLLKRKTQKGEELVLLPKKALKSEPQALPPVKKTSKPLTPPLASSTSNMPDYFHDFVPIENHEQRTRYKEVFNSLYDDYVSLHKVVLAYWVPFDELKEKLSKASNPKEQKKIKSEVDRIYREFKSDRAKVEQKTRFQYVHGKLEHIKKLVVEWDARNQEDD